MHRIDTDGHVGNLFSDGDAGLGVNGTKVDAAWLNAVQEEIANLAESLGVTLAKGTNDQLADSVGVGVARAKGSISMTSGAPYVQNHHNVDEVTRAGETIQIAFLSAMADANYTVVLTDTSKACGAVGTPATIPSVYEKTTAHFKIAWYGETISSGTWGVDFAVF